MDLKKKIMLILGFCVILCIGSYIIITKMFERIEDQLMEKCKIEATVGARVMSEVMSFIVTADILTREDILDTNYVKIPGTNPQKYHTRYDRVFDQYIQEIQDEFLNDPDVEYAVLIDKNGYIPTHNTKYSQKETGNYKRDLIYSRSKRNFANYPAIKQALIYKGPETVKLLYKRDTGEIMWNIGSPVWFQGKHWGAFLIGVNLQRINTIKNQMLILIITIMFVILSLTMLAILAVMPRKYFPSDLDVPRY